MLNIVHEIYYLRGEHFFQKNTRLFAASSNSISVNIHRIITRQNTSGGYRISLYLSSQSVNGSDQADGEESPMPSESQSGPWKRRFQRASDKNNKRRKETIRGLD